jgi:hypothetical protein
VGELGLARPCVGRIPGRGGGASVCGPTCCCVWACDQLTVFEDGGHVFEWARHINYRPDELSLTPARPGWVGGTSKQHAYTG